MNMPKVMQNVQATDFNLLTVMFCGSELTCFCAKLHDK